MNVLEPPHSAKGIVLMAGFLIAALVFASTAVGQQPITYQGQLKQSGAPFTGFAHLQFQLYDSLTGGSQVGPTIARAEWPVEEGLFQVELDFGAGSFGADPRWLQITVDGTRLVPRQRVQAAPMAMFALAGNEGPPGDSHWVINGSATAYLDGPVGIGTSTPAAMLDVRGNSSIGLPQIYLLEQEDDFARLTFGNTVSDRYWTLAALTRGSNALQDRFQLYHSDSGDVIRVNGEGNISIGGFQPSTAYRLIVGDGMLVTRDTSSGTLAHLTLTETAGPEPVRQLFWNSAAARGWRIDSAVDAVDSANDRWSVANTGTGDVFSLLGSGAAGIGFAVPPSALAVHARDGWTWESGNGRGDFHIGDGLVGLSMGVALGGGGRGVSRIWTNGGVENLFIGSAGHGVSLGILPGQVGVNTTSPQATLDVDGDLRVRALADGGAPAERPVVVDPTGNLLAAAPPALRRVAISDAAFKPVDSIAGYQHSAGLYRGETGTAVAAYAHVQVPDGADMQTIRAYILDNSATKNLQVRLWRGNPSTNAVASLAQIVSSGTGSGLDYREFTDLETGPAYDASSPLVLYVLPLQDGTTTPTTWDVQLGISAVIIEFTPPTP